LRNAIPSPFRCEARTHGESLVLVVGGDLDMATVGAVRNKLAAVVEEGWKRIVLDLREVDFIDSQGLHVLLDADREARGGGWSFAIADGSQPLARLLAITGLEDHFERAPD
jgi:anti-sigma B factor antagonist